MYVSDSALGPVGTWHAKFVPFSDSSVWTLYAGATPFSDVIFNVAAVGIAMETSDDASGNVESWIDNVEVKRVNPVLVPAALILFCSGLLALVSLKRRRPVC